MRPAVLVVLMLLAFSLQALAQSPAPPAVSTAPQGTPVPESNRERVVVLFRHGVRAPLDGFTDALAKAHSRDL